MGGSGGFSNGNGPRNDSLRPGVVGKGSLGGESLSLSDEYAESGGCGSFCTVGMVCSGSIGRSFAVGTGFLEMVDDFRGSVAASALTGRCFKRLDSRRAKPVLRTWSDIYIDLH